MAKSLHLQEKVERHLLKVKENNFDMSYNKKKKNEGPLGGVTFPCYDLHLHCV